MKKVFYIILILLLITPCFALEDLDELETRSTRKGQTFYSGEDSGNSYIWQPQTVIYKDTSTDHEMWIWSQTDNAMTGTYATEYN